jgi:hypothetical protein
MRIHSQVMTWRTVTDMDREERYSTHAEGGTQGLDVGLVDLADAREGSAEDRGGSAIDSFADEVWGFVFELFVRG